MKRKRAGGPSPRVTRDLLGQIDSLLLEQSQERNALAVERLLQSACIGFNDHAHWADTFEMLRYWGLHEEAGRLRRRRKWYYCSFDCECGDALGIRIDDLEDFLTPNPEEPPPPGYRPWDISPHLFEDQSLTR